VVDAPTKGPGGSVDAARAHALPAVACSSGVRAVGRYRRAAVGRVEAIVSYAARAPLFSRRRAFVKHARTLPVPRRRSAQ
jgi:hypothetical protein